MRSRDQRRPLLPTRLAPAERDFYMELRRLVDAAGLSFRALEESTSAAKSDSGEASFYNKSQWGRWLNGQSPPPRKAVKKLADKLEREDIEAEHLIDMWSTAFVPTPFLEETSKLASIGFPSRPYDLDGRQINVGLPTASSVPQQLPATICGFAGRSVELQKLTSLLDDGNVSAGTMVISAVDGMPGIGKTALAVYWAHQVTDRFPDGQLYINLRGFDPGGLPVPAAEAIHSFLDAFGISADQVPRSLDAQAGLYRSLLAGRRVLVLLDNARDVEQVRPLLPGSPGCLVLITSRNQLTGLIADGAQPLTLDLPTGAEAHQLLERRLGPDRLMAEPTPVRQMVDLCGRLPLALSIVAARALTHPHFSLGDLAAELRNSRERLDAFEGGDPAANARAVFSWSYQQLSTAAARMFRTLGAYPGPDIAVPAAASMACEPNHSRGFAHA